MTPLTAYCLPWQLTASHSPEALLVDPLRPFLPIELDAWPPSRPPDFSRPLVFVQLRPPPEVLAQPGVRVVWMPMWDDARHCGAAWWRTLPRTLRIVALADPVRRQATRAGLSTLALQYHPDPAPLPPARWDRGRVLFYWNRAGLVGPELLERLCAELDVARLIFCSQIDPGIPAGAAYAPGPRLGRAAVTAFDALLPRAEYEALLNAANLYCAPRLFEGVGLTFLEAMARGCAVLAHDAATMNEYIRPGTNGWLFDSIRPPAWRERLAAGLHRRWPALLPPPAGRTALGRRQPWARLRAADWARLGAQARRDLAAGHARWRAALPRLARFLSEWT